MIIWEYVLYVYVRFNVSVTESGLFFKDWFIALRCTNVYMNFTLKLFQIPTSLHDASDLI
jgi:hypothetical protein